MLLICISFNLLRMSWVMADQVKNPTRGKQGSVEGQSATTLRVYVARAGHIFSLKHVFDMYSIVMYLCN